MSLTQSIDCRDDYTYEIEQLETELIDIKKRINASKAESEASIQADRNVMLLELQRSVESVEETILYVNTGNSYLAYSLEYDGVSTPSSGTLTSQALVCRHLEDMDATFAGLHTAASTGLDRIEDIKQSCDDMDAELARLRFRLASLSGRTGTALALARQTLDANRADITRARMELESTRVELQTLESQTEHKKAARNALRVARAATWTFSVVFPPAIAAAGGLEYAASQMRCRLKHLREETDSADLRLSSLASKVSTMDMHVVSLDQVLAHTHALWARVDAMETDSAGVKTLVYEQLCEYQTVKENTINFSAWTRGVADETAPMRLLGSDSRAALRRTTMQIVGRLLERDQGDVKAICEKLRRINIAPA